MVCMRSRCHHPLPTVTGERTGPGVKRAEDLGLPCTGCSTQESRSHYSPEQHSRAGCGGVGAGELLPVDMQAEPALLLAAYYIG